MVIMVVADSLTILYDNIGIIVAFGGAIIGVIAKQMRNHGWNTAKIDTITKYLNEAHDAIVANHDKFIGLVQAATDLSPELKAKLEASGTDINLVVANTEADKAALKKILDELNALTGNVGVPSKTAKTTGINRSATK